MSSTTVSDARGASDSLPPSEAGNFDQPHDSEKVSTASEYVGGAQQRFVDANGLTFEVFEAGSAEHNGGKLALCLHGFPEHAHSWRFQIPALVAQGYRVWVPNLRGYGGTSTPPHVRDYAMPQLLEDIAGLIDASGATEVTLLAHDWGAVIAWYFAMLKIRPLQRLVIMNVPHPEPMQREIRQNAAQRRSSWYVLFFQIPWLPEVLLGRKQGRAMGQLFRDSSNNPGNFSDADLQVYQRNAARRGGLRGMINYYRALLRHPLKLETTPVIETPTLMLWGEDDMALTKACTYGTEQWVSNLTIRYLPGVSHWVQQDAPQTVNDMLAAWLQDKPVPEMSTFR